jgi:hypothetical protein
MSYIYAEEWRDRGREGRRTIEQEQHTIGTEREMHATLCTHLLYARSKTKKMKR